MSLTKDVIKAFGGNGEPILLTGGEGKSFKVGNIVFKPVANIDEINWISNLVSDLKINGLRLICPIKSIQGEWSYHGWSASNYQPGHEIKGNWDEKIRVYYESTQNSVSTI